MAQEGGVQVLATRKSRGCEERSEQVIQGKRVILHCDARKSGESVSLEQSTLML